jgi:hypothetical protein
VHELSVVVDGDRWDTIERQLAPLFEELGPWVEEWLDEQGKALVDERRLSGPIAVAERFPDLVERVDWVRKTFERDSGHDVPPALFEPVVALVGMAVAARAASGGSGGGWAAPPDARRGLLKLWYGGAAHRRPDVEAPQAAATYLSGAWSPPGSPRFHGRWEPAGILLEAMTYKMVHHGAHTLAGLAVPPWADQRYQRRADFDAEIVKGTHTIVLWLVAVSDEPDDPGADAAGLAAWNWEERTLWEFLCGAVLGPARAGAPHRRRPQAAAFTRTLFGRWAERTVGTTAGTVEVFACPVCVKVHDQPDCPESAGARAVATARRNLFVTPRDRLSGADRERGYVRRKRKVCKNPSCAEALRRLVGWADAEPLYPADLDQCPYCQGRTTGQRQVTVWTRSP